jgi:DNA repair protein RecN (Recombination protein N)
VLLVGWRLFSSVRRGHASRARVASVRLRASRAARRAYAPAFGRLAIRERVGPNSADVESRLAAYHAQRQMLRRLRIENLVLIHEAELTFAPGLNAITGETGAGKTILAQAIGLLLGAKGDTGYIGPDGDEAYVEAELDLPSSLLDEEELSSLAELRPQDEDGLVLARRVFADGRTRAYAWGRGAAREDLAALGERLIAMSGQFEQRRLARPAYQLDVLDSFVGEEQLRRRSEARLAWRQLTAARRRHDELQAGADAEASRLGGLRALVEDTEGMGPEDEQRLREERERLRHVTELAQGAAAAADALAPDEGDGAAGLAAAAERAVAPLERLAPELARAGDELRDVELRLRETASELRGFLTTLEAEPGRLEQVEAELDRIAETKRRFRVDTYAELLARAAEARAELEAIDQGFDPAAAAAEALAAAEQNARRLAAELQAARAEAAPRFGQEVARELVGIGMGEGEFVPELRERELGPAGVDDVAFLIRPNAGLPLAPVAETASGGELSRIALAIAAVGGGETLVFDEIDAGIGGETAHRVAETLRRLGERAQVLTITHLPQIASVADRHFSVEKVAGDPTHTRITQLDEVQRRDELQRMLGGREFLSSVGR